MTNLVHGVNVLAVEVHNVSTSATDMMFGSALIANIPGVTIPRIFVSSENGVSTISWNGEGFTLQRSFDLSSPANWADVPGPVTQSSFIAPNGPTTFSTVASAGGIVFAVLWMAGTLWVLRRGLVSDR